MQGAAEERRWADGWRDLRRSASALLTSLLDRIQPEGLSEDARRALVLVGPIIATIAWMWIVIAAEPFRSGAMSPGQDAHAYYAASMSDPYASSHVSDFGAYLYSPAFLQLIFPLKLLTWRAFLGVWAALLMCVLAWLSGRELFALAVLVTLPDVQGGNIHLLLALAIVLGMRWPGAWAFVLLTKLSPGVGLLWFVARREWRQLGIALGFTALVVAASAVVAPQEWPAWIGVLATNAGGKVVDGAILVPLVVRLPVAVAIVLWGARTNRMWTVPVACLLAVPVMWYGSLTILAATIPLSGRRLPVWLRLRHESLGEATA